MNLFYILYPVHLTLASRFHGGGFFSAPRWVRASVFALPYAAYASYTLFNPYLILLAFVLAFVGKNIGHEDFWLMGTGKSRPDDNTLTKFVKLMKLERDSVLWCWVGMGLKGAITALGTFNPYIIVGHAIALPVAYALGRNLKWGDTAYMEYLSGLSYGIILASF